MQELLKFDQLNINKMLCTNGNGNNTNGVVDNQILSNYVEAPIYFLPTYKFNVNTDIYDTSKK